MTFNDYALGVTLVVLMVTVYCAYKQHKDLEFVRVEGEYSIYRSKSTGRTYAKPRFDPGGY